MGYEFIDSSEHTWKSLLQFVPLKKLEWEVLKILVNSEIVL